MPETTTTVEPSSGLALDAIRRQLDRILASPEYHATDKTRAFLRFVVEEKLAGRSHRLKGYTIAVEVFGAARISMRRATRSCASRRDGCAGHSSATTWWPETGTRS